MYNRSPVNRKKECDTKTKLGIDVIRNAWAKTTLSEYFLNIWPKLLCHHANNSDLGTIN